MFRSIRPPLLAAAAAAVAAIVGCGDDFQLPPATFPNVVQTASLFALDGTPIGLPSAFHIERRIVVRTDQTPIFDFAYNVDTLGRSVLLPTDVVGLGRGSGIRLSSTPFDSIEVAPVGEYVDTLPVAVDVGTVALIRSRPVQCNFGATLPYYAKLEVTAIDTAARRLDFKILTNINCGYRGLEPGFPKR
ncbi:MAG: hypothetical protein ACREMV_05025 [Gemmatimonadales bacterium]